MNGLRLSVISLLLLLVVMSGIQVSWNSHRVRSLHAEIQSVQREHDTRLVENSRLLLERSVESSYRNVERYATEQLGMIFPEVVEQVYR
ncbi:MAG: cell division protein FtsL [Gammaproteobacteria bacterium]|nr:cell division protein FtsL [Gammaproteobacteria bacterium]